jgi:amino acid transporter
VAPPLTSVIPPEPESLRKTLGGWQVLFYGLGSMLGAGIYALVGRAAGMLGNAVWLAFLAAMVVALLTGLSYACLGSRHARAGGAAYITQHAFGWPRLSYVVGLAVMMSGLTSMATGSQAIAENLLRALGPVLPVKVLAIGLVLLIGGVIFRGIRESMWANLACTFVETAGLLFIIAVGLRHWGSVDYLEMPGASAADFSGATLGLVLQGAVLTFFSFIGFEDILNVSEEVKQPRRDIPFGLIGAMVVATLIYLGVAITAVSVMPWRDLAQSSAPLMDVARIAAPWFTGINGLYLGITIFAIGNTVLLNYVMGSRLLYGMSRQGLLPAALARIHPVRRTPHIAIVVLFGIVVVLILSGGIRPMAEATVLLLLGVFTVVNLALVRLQGRAGEPRGDFEVPRFVPLLGAVVCAVLIVVRMQSALANPANRVAPLIALAIVAASLGLYSWLKPKTVAPDSGDR